MGLTKRQIQVAKLIHEELASIFTKQGWTMMDGGMVSISEVVISPDLLEAKIYLSFLNIKEEAATLELFKTRMKEIRGALGNALRHSLRRIPYLEFYQDKMLENVFRLEEIFKEIDLSKDQKDEKDID